MNKKIILLCVSLLSAISASAMKQNQEKENLTTEILRQLNKNIKLENEAAKILDKAKRSISKNKLKSATIILKSITKVDTYKYTKSYEKAKELLQEVMQKHVRYMINTLPKEKCIDLNQTKDTKQLIQETHNKCLEMKRSMNPETRKKYLKELGLTEDNFENLEDTIHKANDIFFPTKEQKQKARKKIKTCRICSKKFNCSRECKRLAWKKHIKNCKKIEPAIFCNFCQKTSDLKCCSACKQVYYCSRDCQIKDWNTHKITCKTVKK